MEERGEIVLYQTEDGLTKLDVKLRDDTVWLSLEQMAELFGRDKSTVSRHIRNVFAEGELCRDAVVAIIIISTLSSPWAIASSPGEAYSFAFGRSAF